MASRQIVSEKALTIFWFRRDLRFADNRGLARAMAAGAPVLPLFIFDTEILSKLSGKGGGKDARVEFIHAAVSGLGAELEKNGSSLLVANGSPLEVWKNLVAKFPIKSVYCNHDYEPYAIERDSKVRAFLLENGIQFHSFKDQVIFEKREVVKDNGEPYSVFTPFSRKWKSLLKESDLKAEPSQGFDAFVRAQDWRDRIPKIPTLKDLGFAPAGIGFPKLEMKAEILKKYEEQRNFPAIAGTSRLGVHLRFGTISVREAVRVARKQSETFLNELIWREFFMQILANYPHVATGPYRKEYGKIKFRHDEKDFQSWCEGKTGFPIVDAGMRELNETGFMHNRVRMIAASFLVKQLLIDWRWGEKYFADKLLDFDLASNNGNWQWVAGTGCDAAPYFRVFNPDNQSEKFDPKQEYIKKWVPELGTGKYPEPMINLKSARLRALKVYAEGLGKKAPSEARDD